MRAVISRMCAHPETVEFKGGRLHFNIHKNYHNINRGSVDSLSIQLINKLIFLLFGLEGVFIV